MSSACRERALRVLEHLQSSRPDPWSNIRLPISYPLLLGSVQKVVLQSNPGADAATIQAEIKAGIDDINQALNQPPETRFEDPLHYLHLQTITQPLLAAASRLGHRLPPIVFGTVPKGFSNARAMRIRGCDQYVVVVLRGFFTFAGHIGDIAAQLLEVGESDLDGAGAGNQPMGSEDEDEQEMMERAVAWATAWQRKIMTWVEARPYILQNFRVGIAPLACEEGALVYQEFPKQLTPLARALSTSLLSFAVAHELGHVLAGHFEDKNALAPTIDEELDEIKKDPKLEEEADLIGASITQEAMARWNPAGKPSDVIEQMLLTHAIFFCGAMVVRRAIQFLNNEPNQEIEEFIKAISSREEALKAHLKGLCPGEQTERACRRSTNLQLILWLLWHDAAPEYIELRKRGIRSAWSAARQFQSRY